MKKEKLILLIVIIGFVVYFNCLFNGFVWDDEEQVVNNVLVHSLSNFPLFFKGSTFNPGGGGAMGGLYYKPMMTVCFSFLYTLFGPRPFFFHLFQLLLHLGNAILVFILLDHFLKKLKLSFFLSLIFLIHPMNVETVVYVAALQETLFFFFGMLALILVIKEPVRIKNNGVIYLSTSFLLLLSLLSKETGIIFFALIFFYLLIFKRDRFLNYFIFFLVSLAAYLILRFGLAGIYFQKHNLSPITRMSFGQRLMSVPQIIFFYLKTFFYPKDLAISQHWVVKSLTFVYFYLSLILVSAFFFVLGIILTIFLRPSKDGKMSGINFLFFLLWFIFSLGFHLQLFPLDLTVSDRWFYLPMVGLLGMVGVILSQQRKFFQNFVVFNIFGVVLIILLSIRTFIRTFDWRNGLTLYSHDVKISKNAFDLENNFGVELFRVGRFDEAKIHFENSTELASYWWTNWNNLGVVYERKGELGKAATYYKKAIDNGNYYLAYENYAGILIKQDKKKEAKEFLEKEALPRLPYNQKLRQLYLYLTRDK